MFVSNGTQISDLLSKLGLSGSMLGARIDLLQGNPVGALRNLADAFEAAQRGLGADKLTGAPLQPFGAVPPPADAFGRNQAGVRPSYQRIDLAPNAPDFGVGRMGHPDGRAAMRLERLVMKNPEIKAELERALGGRIVLDGRPDGKITVVRYPEMHASQNVRDHRTGAGSPNVRDHRTGADSTLGRLAGLGGLLAGFGIGAPLVAGAMNPLAGLALGGLTNVLGTRNPLGSILGGGLGLFGQGQWNPNTRPGVLNNNSAFQERVHQAEVDNVLNDRSLTVEDKLTLVLMLIMKKMDKDIENETERLSKLQQQQGQADGGGNRGSGKGNMLGTIGGLAGTAFGGPLGGMVGSMAGNFLAGNGLPGSQGSQGGPNGSSPSIDIEAMKVKRMVEKRGQMFDILKGITESYGKTAKGIIDSIAR